MRSKSTLTTWLTILLALSIGLGAAFGAARFQKSAESAHEAELAVARLRVVLDQFEQLGIVVRLKPEEANAYAGQVGGYAYDAQELLTRLAELAPGPLQQQLQSSFEELVDTMIRIRLKMTLEPEGLADYIEEIGVPAREAFEAVLTSADRSFHERAVTQQRFANLGMWSVLLFAALCSGALALLNGRLRRRTAQILIGQEAHFRSLVQYGADLISVLDPDLNVRFQSPSVKSLLGFSPEEIETRPFAAIVHPEDRDAFDRMLAESAPSPENAVTRELRLMRSDGAVRTVEVIANNLSNHPDVRGYVLNSRDITERLQASERIEFQAMHDELTGLPNRRLLMDRLTQGIARANRSVASIAVIFVDLNDFKDVNDNHGHDAGDRVLRASAQRIQQSIRQEDTAARLGGDEFVVMLEIKSPQEAQIIADRITRSMNKPFMIGRQEVSVSISLGVAIHDPQEDIEELLRRADLAMYSGKNAGIVEAVMFDATMEPVSKPELVKNL